MRFLFAIMLLVGSTGCGPIVSGKQIRNADVALSAAATAGAQRTAVYEYTAAEEYLQKAREEHAYSDFWASRIYADKALDYAERATKKAIASGGGPTPAVLEEPPPPEASTPPVEATPPEIAPIP